MKIQMTALAILLSSVVTANAGNGWNFFGITVPYHNDPCWEMYTDPLYRDQCNPKARDNSLSPVVNQPVATPPKDDKPQVDDNGGDSDTGGGDEGTDPGDDHNGGDTKDDTKDYNGGDTRDNSDTNGGDSSDDSNGGNSDDRGDKKNKKRDRK